MVRWCFCCYCCCCCCWKIRARYCVAAASPRHTQGSAVGGWSGRIASLLRSLHAHDHDDNEDNNGKASPPAPAACPAVSTPCSSPAAAPHRRATSLRAPPHSPGLGLQHSHHARPRHYGSVSDLLVKTSAATKDVRKHRASVCTCGVEGHIGRPIGDGDSVGSLDPVEEPEVVVLGTTPGSKEDSGRRYTALLSGLDRIRSRLTGSSSSTSVGDRRGSATVGDNSEEQTDKPQSEDAPLCVEAREEITTTARTPVLISNTSSSSVADRSSARDNSCSDSEDSSSWCGQEGSVPTRLWRHYSSTKATGEDPRRRQRRSSGDSVVSEGRGRPGVGEGVGRVLASTLGQWRRLQGSVGTLTATLRRRISQERPDEVDQPDQCGPEDTAVYHRLQEGQSSSSVARDSRGSQSNSSHDSNDSACGTPQENQVNREGGVAAASSPPPTGVGTTMARRGSDTSSYCEGEPMPKRMSLQEDDGIDISLVLGALQAHANNNNIYNSQESDVSSKAATTTRTASPPGHLPDDDGSSDPVIVTHTIETSFLAASPPPPAATTVVPENIPSDIPLTSSRRRFFQEMTRADSLCEDRDFPGDVEGGGWYGGAGEEGRHVYMTGTAEMTTCLEEGEGTYLSASGTHSTMGEVHSTQQYAEESEQLYDPVASPYRVSPGRVSPDRASPLPAYDEDDESIEGAHYSRESSSPRSESVSPPRRESTSPRTRSNITIQFTQAVKDEEEEARKRKQREDQLLILTQEEQYLSEENLEIHDLLDGTNIPDNISDAFNMTAEEILSGEEEDDIPVINISTHPLISGSISKEGSPVSDLNNTTDIVDIIHTENEPAYEEADNIEVISANIVTSKASDPVFDSNFTYTCIQPSNSDNICPDSSSSPENEVFEEQMDQSQQMGSSLLTEVLHLVMSVPTNETMNESDQSEQIINLDETRNQLDDRTGEDLIDRTRHSDDCLNLNNSYEVLEDVKSDEEILDTSKSDGLLDTTKSDEEIQGNSKSDDNPASSKSDERLLSLKSDDLLVSSSKSDDGYPDTMKSDIEFRELLDTTKSEDDLADTTKSDEILDTTKSEDLLDTTKSDDEIEDSDANKNPKNMGANGRSVAWKVLSGWAPLSSATQNESGATNTPPWSTGLTNTPPWSTGLTNTPPWSPSCHSTVVSGDGPSSCSSPIQQQATYTGEVSSHMGSLPSEVIGSIKNESNDSLMMEVDDPGGGITTGGERRPNNNWEGATMAESGAASKTADSSIGGSEGPKILITPVWGEEGGVWGEEGGGVVSSGTTPTIVVESGSGGSMWESTQGATSLMSYDHMDKSGPVNVAAHLAANPRPPKPKSPITVDEWVAALPLLGSCSGGHEEEEEAWGGGGGQSGGVNFGGTITYHLDDFNLGAEAGLMAGSAATSESNDGQHPSTSTPITRKHKTLTPAPPHRPHTPTRSRPLTLRDIPGVLLSGDGQKSPGGPSSLSGIGKWATLDSRRLQFSSKQASFQSEISALSLQSTKSSIDSLLESRAPDPVEVLLNLGFGKSDEEGIQRIPQRFLKPSEVPGNDIDDFMKSEDEFSDRVESEMVLGLNPQ
ncbi:unnamed protein product, partial [Meganyctiphanes norvegica]